MAKDNTVAPAMPVTPIHDAILPYEYQGVIWAIPNIGDNVETENTSMAELFEATNKTLMTLSNFRANFVISPPDLDLVKAMHNSYQRFIRFVDSRTKKDNQSRMTIEHVTPNRRRFTRYPVRYFDVKNRWTKQFLELWLYTLSNMAQLSSANTYTNDWDEASARLITRGARESYRILCIDLFGKDLEVYKDESDFPLLTPDDFANYNPSALIPTYELLDSPYTAFFTEDRLRDVSTPSVKPGVGVTPTGGDTISPGENSEQQVRDAQKANTIIP